MDRKAFLSALAVLPFAGAAVNLRTLAGMTDGLKRSERMPLLFLGHGSPMNAIEENEFVRGFRGVANTIPKPQAILCISAHWETNGTFVTAMQQPRTIHDFGGFPDELYAVRYPAPGSPQLAKATRELVRGTAIQEDHGWGLDHGAWSVLKHLYPAADVPVIQLSLDAGQPPRYHYELAKELAALRDKGILIVGSGNIVHNLRRVAWDKLNADGYGFDWALEANESIKKYIRERDHKVLLDYAKQGEAFRLAIPTPEHYLPLIYMLAPGNKAEDISIFNDKAVGGAITMTSVRIG
jgi:4,5-DOPA dioxygenase extradiol